MPFIGTTGELGDPNDTYIVDEDLLIDSDDADRGDGLTFEYYPPRVINNVVAMEVSEIQLSRSLTGLFAVGGWVDFLFRSVDLSDATPPVDYLFSFQLPTGDSTTTLLEAQQYFSNAFNFYIREQFTDGDWITADSVLPVEFEGALNTKMTITIKSPYGNGGGIGRIPQRTLGMEEGRIIEYIDMLNETGEHASESVFAILGYDPVDLRAYRQSPSPTRSIFDLFSQNTVTLSPYHYIDVRIQEVPEFVPFFRFYPDVDSYTQRQALPGITRIMTDPIRKLERLRITLRLPEGLLPRVESNPTFIHLKVFYLQSGLDVPEYMKRRELLR